MSAEHKGGHEKKETVASRAFKWLKERAQDLTNTAFKLGLGMAGIGLAVDVFGSLVGVGPVVTLGKAVLGWGIVLGAGGFAGRLITGKPKEAHH